MGINVLVVTNGQMNQFEKAQNDLLGDWFKSDKTYDGNGDIDVATCDFTIISKELNTGKGVVNADKMILFLQALPSAQLTEINTRFGTDVIAWIQANMVDVDTIELESGPA